MYEKKEQKSSLEVFESAPIGQAVMKNTIPAMVAMLMVLIYNLADTFFIGQTKLCSKGGIGFSCNASFLVVYGPGNCIWDWRYQCYISCHG